VGFFEIESVQINMVETERIRDADQVRHFRSILKIIADKMEVTEIMNNSLGLEIIKKVIFKDYQMALLPYISAGEIDSDNAKSMEQLPASKKHGPCK
jgi:hypothetical protein